ncbi:MAG: sugar transferase, partial [Acidimicrobiales bacterium]
IGEADLALCRDESGLRAVVAGPVTGVDQEAAGLTWRAIAVVARSLRLTELWVEKTTTIDGVAHIGWTRIDKAELKLAARLAETLEIERVANQPRPDRTAASAGRPTGAAVVVPQRLSDDPVGDDGLPAIRFDLGLRLPRWKRSVDLGLGLLALVATTPLWLISALLVKGSGDGPILYRQVRIGTGGLPFQIYKFRTMYLDNDDSAHRRQNRLELRGEADAAKDGDDPRITPVGRRLRRLSLDELPQLLNVMRSEMSLVGPRPSLVWESELFEPSTRRRLTTTPGLTGLWQTSGRADVSMAEMLQLDLDYVDRMGPAADIRCLAKTASSVVAGRGAR